MKHENTMKIKFLFDLDGTLTREETLPIIASKFDLSEEITPLTRETIVGNVPFVESFITRVNLLRNIPPFAIADTLEDVPLYDLLIDFIKNNHDICVVVTGNCDIWVDRLMHKIGCEYKSSKVKFIDNKVSLQYILKKEDVVEEYKKQGYFVVFVGDGNNDSEAMRRADLSIACGLTHMPAISVLNICDYAIFSETALYQQLCNIINPASGGLSVVLSCAGVGSRIGLGVTKALLQFDGECILERHLSNFRNIQDLRIVVGFQAVKVIELVLSIRSDVVFVFNHDYFHTKTGYSYYLGARHANKYVIEWDGDLIVHPDDISGLLSYPSQYVAGTPVSSEDPVFLKIDNSRAIGFSRHRSEEFFEWTGPCMLERENICRTDGHVFEIIEPYLPLPFLKIEAYDIDTHEDYIRVKKIIKGWV